MSAHDPDSEVMEPLTPDRRRQQTREHLLAAAGTVFAARGFHGTTLDEVARVAGFTKGAVYSNFKSKDDLFLSLLEYRYQSAMERLRTFLETVREPHVAADFKARITDDPEGTDDSWGSLYQEFLVYALRNPEARHRLAELERADLASLADLLARERERHGIDDEHSVDEAAVFVLALMRGLSTMRLIDPPSVNETRVAAVLDFLQRALAPGT